MADTKTIVHFTCQHCLHPLKLSSSCQVLSILPNLKEISAPILLSSDVDLESHAASFNHIVPGFRLTDSKTGSNGFTLVDQKGDGDCLSKEVAIAAQLFDTLSATSEVDHPLCEECTDALLQLLEEQLKFTQDELNDYIAFSKRCENSDNSENIDQLQKELVQYEEEEKALLQELKLLQNEEMEMQKKLEEEEQERERLDQEEARYWREYSHHRHHLMVAENESKSLDCQYQYSHARLQRHCNIAEETGHHILFDCPALWRQPLKHLDFPMYENNCNISNLHPNKIARIATTAGVQLKQTNVFTSTFHIWHSGGHFGTINHFRLGRLPTAPVDWSEINAGWGQTALLLNALSRKIGLTFQRYRLVPYGNHSYIVVLADQKELPLYGAGGLRFLWDPKFDSAMIAFLDCFQQFIEEMEKVNPEFRLPYRINQGKLEDAATRTSLSIKIQFNSEEQWTKALKFLLTNLKWALAWVASQFVKNEDSAD